MAPCRGEIEDLSITVGQVVDLSSGKRNTNKIGHAIEFECVLGENYI